LFWTICSRFNPPVCSVVHPHRRELSSWLFLRKSVRLTLDCSHEILLDSCQEVLLGSHLKRTREPLSAIKTYSNCEKKCRWFFSSSRMFYSTKAYTRPPRIYLHLKPQHPNNYIYSTRSIPTSLFMSNYKPIQFKLFVAILTKMELFWSLFN
jgi:hypothetical protein